MEKPKFVPKPGQVDYTNIRRVPVVNCVAKYGEKILLVQRSATMNFYPGLWNGVAGYLDDDKNVTEKAKEELREEVGIEEKDIFRITEGKAGEQEEANYGKTWIVHPVLAEVKTDKIKLDWEAEQYAWILPKKAKKYKLVPGFQKVLEALQLI